MPSSLEVPRRPRRAGRSRLWRVVAVVAAVVLVAGWIVWYVLTPDDLPVQGRRAEAAGVAGTPVYVGVFTMPDGDRTIHVSAVDVPVAQGDGLSVAVEPVVCRGGSIGVTTVPEDFCEEVVDGADGELGSGDSVALRLVAETPGTVSVDRISISFRDGIRWGTQDVGIAGVTASFADAPAPAPEVSEEEPADEGAGERPDGDEQPGGTDDRDRPEKRTRSA
jgi:hypothetical protein